MASFGDRQRKRTELDRLMSDALDPREVLTGEVGELYDLFTPELPDSELIRTYVGKFFGVLANRGIGIVPPPDEEDPGRIAFLHPSSVGQESLARITEAFVGEIDFADDVETFYLSSGRLSSLASHLLAVGEYHDLNAAMQPIG